MSLMPLNCTLKEGYNGKLYVGCILPQRINCKWIVYLKGNVMQCFEMSNSTVFLLDIFSRGILILILILF